MNQAADTTNIGSDSVTGKKITALQSIILEQASEEKASIVADARQQAQQWLSAEMTKLDRETAAVLADASARSEDIRRRRILATEKEKSTEALRLQNRLLQDALNRFLDALVHLRDRKDYVDILSALALTGARNLVDAYPLKLRLAAIDIPLGEEVVKRVNEKHPDAGMELDHDPAPILGGCWVSGADGRQQVNYDWQSRAQDMADTLAERLLPLL